MAYYNGYVCRHICIKEVKMIILELACVAFVMTIAVTSPLLAMWMISLFFWPDE